MPTPTCKTGFNGELHEAHAAWQFLGNGYRVYSPALMRFHSPDSVSPFGPGGINAYAYCSGEPINHADPSGHFLLPVAALLGLASVGTLGAAVVTGKLGNGRDAALLGAIGGALAIAAMGALGVHAVKRGVKVPDHLLGDGEAMVWRGRDVDIVRVHGRPYGSQWGKGGDLNGSALAAKLKPVGDRVPRANTIELQSCYGAVGDEASQAQALATASGKKVWAYPGRITTKPGNKHLITGQVPVVFKPLAGMEGKVSLMRNAAMNLRTARDSRVRRRRFWRR